MSDKATMLRETDEALANLSTILDELTEEQARRIRLSVLGVQDLVIHWPGMLRERGGKISEADESIHNARTSWAPGSFWGLRYPGEPNRVILHDAT